MGDFPDAKSYYIALLQMIQDDAWIEDEDELILLVKKLTCHEREKYENTISRMDPMIDKMRDALKILLDKEKNHE